MIDLDFLERLIRAIDQSSIDSVEIERGGTRIRVGKTPTTVASNSSSPGASAPLAPLATPAGPETNAAAPAPGAAPPPAAPPPEAEPRDDLVEVTSPMVGTFYRAPSPDQPPYADVGERVAKGDTLCIIEAMKLMNELESEVSGTVAEVCVENGEPVEFGQVLFRIEPA